MNRLDPDEIRSLVREALEGVLGTRDSRVPRVASRDRGTTHCSHLELIDECGDGQLSRRKPCWIEPHQLCMNSGYCRKLGY